MRLKRPTSTEWVEAVLKNLDTFLLDHAACERKASAAAMTLVTHYPDRGELVDACIELAREELRHFQDVYRLIAARGLTLAPDTPSPYIARLSRQFRQGSDAYFLDRLLVAAIAEARGCERFALLASALAPGDLQDFYRGLARAEARHHELYAHLAALYFNPGAVAARLEELLDLEADAVAALPLRPALY